MMVMICGGAAGGAEWDLRNGELDITVEPARRYLVKHWISSQGFPWTHVKFLDP